MAGVFRAKKKLVLLYVVTAFKIFAQTSIPDFAWYFMRGIYFVGNENTFYEVNTDAKEYRDITKLCYTDSNGFLRINIDGNNSDDFMLTKNDTYYLILSKRYFTVIQNNEEIEWQKNTTDDSLLFVNPSIQSIHANSYVIENNIHYSAEGFKKRFFATDLGLPLFYLNRTPPFALSEEQMDNFYMDIEFVDGADGMLLLNGFVDMRRPNLYKENARVKEIAITIDGLSSVYTLEDRIEFQEIIFKKQSKKVRLEIISFYQGEKYTDICLSALSPIFYDKKKHNFDKMYWTEHRTEFLKEFLTHYREIK